MFSPSQGSKAYGNKLLLLSCLFFVVVLWSLVVLIITTIILIILIISVTEFIVCVQGHGPLTFSFLSSFLFFDWVGVLWP